MDGEVLTDQRATDEQPQMLRLIGELRKRQLFKIGAAYAVAAWLVIQVTDIVGPAFDLPAWVLRAVILTAIAGFLLTMGLLLFRVRRDASSSTRIYLSHRARLVAGAGVLLVAAGAAVLSIRSLGEPKQVTLAVLPFADLSPQRDKAFFAEGVAEEILSTLAAQRDIRVLGRTSARQIERDPNPSTIRASLGVTHLLEGSTRTAGDQLRVNVRLIDTGSGSQLWEEEYKGRLTDVFTVQDQIAATVVKRLHGTFFGAAVRQAKETTIDAYQTYLAARALMRTRSEKTLRQALSLAQKTVTADPNYAPGHALYAELVFLLSDELNSYGDIPLEKARAIAIPHARRAVQLAPSNAEGYGALGLILPRHEAIEPLKRAIALDPARAELRIWLGVALGELHRHDEAFEQYSAAYQVEPLWPVALNRVNQVLSASGRHSEAITEVQRYLRRGGAKPQGLRFMATIAASQGDFSEAIATREAALAGDPNLPFLQRWLAIDSFRLGFVNEARGIFPPDSGFTRLLITKGRQALLRAAERDVGKMWSRPDPDTAVLALGAARNWAALVSAFDAVPPSYNLCGRSQSSASVMLIALRRTGREAQARSLAHCVRNVLARIESNEFRGPFDAGGGYEYKHASFAAADGRNQDAIRWLRRGIARGFVGSSFSTRLTDHAQFESLTGEPAYAGLQRIIDQHLKRERGETFARLGRPPRYSAVS